MSMDGRSQRQRRRQQRVTALFVVGAATLTACSTVTRPADSLGIGQSTMSTSSAPPATTSTGAGRPGAGAAGGSVGGSVGSATRGTGATGGTASGSTGAAGGLPTTGTVTRPACTKTLKIGVSWSSDFGAAVAAAGAGSSAEGSNYADALKKFYSIGIQDLNRRGGLGGCKAELALHDFKVTAADGFDGQSQQECSDFAEDQKVFAVYPAWFETEVLISCLQKHRIPVFPGPGMFYFPDKAAFAQYRGTLYGPTHVAVDRLGPVMDMFYANGYFKGAKVGFLLDEDNKGINRRLVEKLWKPRLAQLKVPVVATFASARPPGTSGSGDQAAAMSSAVVQFQRAGVTHVITTPDNGGSIQVFAPVADSQGYHPRLGLVSTSGAEILALTSGSVPAASKVGAMAVSWTLYDFAGRAGGGWERNPSNTARDACLKLYAKEAAANNFAMPSLFPWCDTLNLLYEALKGAASVPTAASLLQGVENLGKAFVNVTGYGPAPLGPGRYDGGEQVRVMSWNSRTTNWDYVTGLLTLP